MKALFALALGCSLTLSLVGHHLARLQRHTVGRSLIAAGGVGAESILGRPASAGPVAQRCIGAGLGERRHYWAGQWRTRGQRHNHRAIGPRGCTRIGRRNRQCRRRQKREKPVRQRWKERLQRVKPPFGSGRPCVEPASGRRTGPWEWSRDGGVRPGRGTRQWRRSWIYRQSESRQPGSIRKRLRSSVQLGRKVESPHGVRQIRCSSVCSTSQGRDGCPHNTDRWTKRGAPVGFDSSVSSSTGPLSADRSRRAGSGIASAGSQELRPPVLHRHLTLT